jgi:hypothetical protein
MILLSFVAQNFNTPNNAKSPRTTSLSLKHQANLLTLYLKLYSSAVLSKTSGWGTQTLRLSSQALALGKASYIIGTNTKAFSRLRNNLSVSYACDCPHYVLSPRKNLTVGPSELRAKKVVKLPIYDTSYNLVVVT